MLPDAVTFGSLLNLDEARLVVIHDVWSGYNPASPIAAVYDLRRTPSKGFRGEGRFSTSLAEPRTVSISMKSATATAFLEALMSARLSPGPYVPFEDHTDDYPTVEIAIHVGAGGRRGSGIAMLHTTSQGEHNAPWAVFVGGTVHVAKGDEIGRALGALNRTLKRAELERMTGVA